MPNATTYTPYIATDTDAMSYYQRRYGVSNAPEDSESNDSASSLTTPVPPTPPVTPDVGLEQLRAMARAMDTQGIPSDRYVWTETPARGSRGNGGSIIQQWNSAHQDQRSDPDFQDEVLNYVMDMLNNRGGIYV